MFDFELSLIHLLVLDRLFMHFRFKNFALVSILMRLFQHLELLFASLGS